MKKILFVFVILFLSLSLFAQENIFPDNFKTKKITLKESKINLNDLIKKISEETKENILVDDDWRVSEREIVIYGKDATLYNVLHSIEVVTKLIWVKEDDKYILKYDLNTDNYINQLNSITENKQIEARKNIIDNYFKEDENVDIEALKKNDPMKYISDSTGLTKTVGGIIDNVPGVKEALINGTQMSFNGSNLSDEAINNMNLTQSISRDFMSDLVNGNKNVDRRFKRQINKQRKTEFPEDKSRITLEVNNHYNKDFNNFMVGNLEIKVDGKSVGFVPIANTQNDMVKKMGSMMADMYENHNFDPKTALNEMRDDMFQTLRSSANKDEIYDSFKNPIPNLAYFQNNIKLSANPASKFSSMELLSESTGKLCVCDDYSNFLDNLPLSGIDPEGTVEEIINIINNTYGLTMKYDNDQFCFYTVKWFEEIQKLMPKAYYEKWAQQYENDLFISLDNLYEMAMFTDKQIRYGLSKKPSLNNLSGEITKNINTIRFLANLEDESYKKITSSEGIRLFELSILSQNNLIAIKEFQNIFNETGPILKVKFEKFDDKEVINLIATDSNNNNITIQINLKKYAQNPINFDFLNK